MGLRTASSSSYCTRWIWRHPSKNMSSNREMIIKDSVADLALTGAELFGRAARKCVAEKGRFAVAISGGSTPRPMHRLLAEPPYRHQVPWSKTHIFWVDERCVSQDNPASNYGTAKQDFLDRLPIPPGQVHPMPAEDLPEEGAKKYEMALRAFFKGEQDKFPVLDLIFLGLGNDGHTASLFPGQGALGERKKWIVNVAGGNPNVSRLTMTFSVLNHAGHLVFLVAGKDKARTVKAVLEERATRLPAEKIQPRNGKLTWLLDREAASLLTRV